MSCQQQNVFAALSVAQATPIDPQERVYAWLYDEHARRWLARDMDPLTYNEFRRVYLGLESIYSDDGSESESSGTDNTASFHTARSRFSWVDSLFEGSLGRQLLARFEEGYEADVSESLESDSPPSMTGSNYTIRSSISLAALYWYELGDDEAHIISEGINEFFREQEERERALAGTEGATVEPAEDSAQPANEPEPQRPATEASPITQGLANIDSYFAEARRTIRARAEHAHSKGEWKADMAKLDELDRREQRARKALQEHLEVLYA